MEVLQEILREELEHMASEYLVAKDEMQSLALDIDHRITVDWLQRMFQSADRRVFVRSEFEPLFRATLDGKPQLREILLDEFACLMTEYALADERKSVAERQLSELVDDEELSRMRDAKQLRSLARREFKRLILKEVEKARPEESHL